MINAVVFDLLVSFHITNDGVQCVAIRREIGRNSGFSPVVFVRGHFQEIGIAALPVGLKPRYMEKFRQCRLTDVGKSELTEKNRRNMRKT